MTSYFKIVEGVVLKDTDYPTRGKGIALEGEPGSGIFTIFYQDGSKDFDMFGYYKHFEFVCFSTDRELLFARIKYSTARH